MMLSRSLLLLASSLPLFSSSSLSSPHVISLPLTRHTYDRMPNPHEIHTMATGTQVLTQGCAVNNFFTPVQIGFNQYRLTVDSLMATTSIADATCTNCGVSPLYMAGPTALATKGTLTQTYPTGKGWTGITYTDDFTLPGQTALPKINIGFGGITSQVGGFFPSSRCDGLNSTYNSNQGTLGLGHPASILPGTTPFFDTLLTSTTPRIDAIMAFQMCSVGGRLWLGGFDNTFMIGLPSFTPLVGTTSYAVTISDVAYGGVTTGIPSASFGTVVLDTTSTNMLFPQTVYNTITQLILANPDFVAAFGSTFFSNGSCITPNSGLSIDTLNTMLPHLTISMGTQVILDMQPVSSYIREFITLTKSTSGIIDSKRYCPGIGVSAIPTKTTLGWTFLNQFTTVIDRLNVRVGFARTSNCGGFVGADANFINIPTTTTNTPTPFTQTPAFIGVIVVIVVVSLVLLGIAIFFGRRYYNSTEYKSRMSSLNYSTNAPNVKVQFADPVVGSKGFLGPTPTQQQQPLTRNAASSASSLNAPPRNAAHSVEEDGVFTDSPLAGSPLSSMNTTPRNNFAQQEMSRMPARPPRAMVAQRGMMGGPQQQQWGGEQQWNGQQQQPQIRNPGQLSTPEQPPPRKVYGGVGGARGGGQASEWAEAFDQEGNAYYYNARTQETTWDRPAGFVSRSY